MFIFQRQRAAAQGYNEIPAINIAEDSHSPTRQYPSVFRIWLTTAGFLAAIASAALYWNQTSSWNSNNSKNSNFLIMKQTAISLSLAGDDANSFSTESQDKHHDRGHHDGMGDNDDHHHHDNNIHRCHGIDWQQACQRITSAGARRHRKLQVAGNSKSTEDFSELEQAFLKDADNPSVVYDENCLRVYRLDLFGNTTFPYHASNLLRAGGNQTMALFIQHGAMRNADAYFCSFRSLMLEQTFRPFEDIMVIAPDFNYRNDPGVLETDAFWNGTKPWGDWRAGAESDPQCCGNKIRTHGGRTISSFAILDRMLQVLTDSNLYPNMEKISYVGHSAGGQMVQRYAIMSQLAAKWDSEGSRVDMEFVIANPSSYSYLDDRRWTYSCGDCKCNSKNCTCNQDCTDPFNRTLQIPNHQRAQGHDEFVCEEADYDNWPYGLGSFSNGTHSFPYLSRSGPKRAARAYRHRDVVYMVGLNDTCNDGLPTCSESCWKRTFYDETTGEGPCYRNHMDTRCPAMLEGPHRRARGKLYMKYLEELYGKQTHVLHVIPGVGHDASAMFGSDVGLRELFD